MVRHEFALSPEGIEAFVHAVAELAVEWVKLGRSVSPSAATTT
jgi:hypothetical protein